MRDGGRGERGLRRHRYRFWHYWWAQGIAANLALVVAGNYMKWVNKALTQGSLLLSLRYLVATVLVMSGVMMLAKAFIDTNITSIEVRVLACPGFCARHHCIVVHTQRNGISKTPSAILGRRQDALNATRVIVWTCRSENAAV